ncbi:hypothetical protein V2J56_12550, partial [Georgenia sp. MJ206]
MTRRTVGARCAPVLALSACLALVLAGCGSAEAGAQGGESIELGPLDEYVEQAYGEFDEDQMTREMQDVEEAVAACMAEEGF